MDLQERRKIASDHSLGTSHQRIYERAIVNVSKYARGGQFADFGAGQGDFLKLVAATKIFSQMTGIDLMAAANDLPAHCQWLAADLNQAIALADETFDFISALEVIEHLENPRHTMRELYRLSKPQGIVLLSTPNNESYRSLVSYFFRGHFVAFTDRSYPAHITPLNRKDLTRAASEAGFEVIDFDYTNLGCIPGLTRLSWQQVSFGLAKGLRYSDNFYIILKKK